jgi:hypothetical protein
LLSNNFQLYYKPYSKWSSVCQAKYPTTEVISDAKEAQDIASSLKTVMIMSSVIFCVNFFFYIVLA